MIAEKYKIKKNSNKRQLHEILTLNKSKTNGTVKVIFITKSTCTIHNCLFDKAEIFFYIFIF